MDSAGENQNQGYVVKGYRLQSFHFRVDLFPACFRRKHEALRCGFWEKNATTHVVDQVVCFSWLLS